MYVLYVMMIIFWSQNSHRAIVLYTSDIPQSNVGTCLGPLKGMILDSSSKPHCLVFWDTWGSLEGGWDGVGDCVLDIHRRSSRVAGRGRLNT